VSAAGPGMRAAVVGEPSRSCPEYKNVRYAKKLPTTKIASNRYRKRGVFVPFLDVIFDFVSDLSSIPSHYYCHKYSIWCESFSQHKRFAIM
jgi:hypothetical protein